MTGIMSVDSRTDADALRAFSAVARLGTVQAAARELRRTQPSISARLAGLESSWGLRLFYRRSRGMELTPEGTRLLPLASRVLENLQELDEAAGLPVARATELRLGAGDALGRELLPRMLRRLQDETPDVTCRVLEGGADRLREALRRGDIDLALVASSATGDLNALHSTDREAFDHRPLLSSTVELVLPAGTERQGRRPLALSSLKGRPLVFLQPGSAFRRHVERALRLKGLDVQPAVTVGSLSLVLRHVAAGLGWAPVPTVALGEGPLRGITRRRLSDIPPVHYHCLTRRDAPLPLPVTRLLELLS